PDLGGRERGKVRLAGDPGRSERARHGQGPLQGAAELRGRAAGEPAEPGQVATRERDARAERRLERGPAGADREPAVGDRERELTGREPGPATELDGRRRADPREAQVQIVETVGRRRRA